MSRPEFRSGGPRRGGEPHQEEWGSGGRPSFSRTQIQHLIRTEFARARRHGYPVACAILAVDRLTERVTAFGEGIRKAAMQSLQVVVHEGTRSSDYLGLVDADRFLLVLSHTTVWDAERVVDRIRQSFAGLEIAVDGQDLEMTLSAGISGAAPPDPPLFETVLTKADGGLERARRDGNRILAVP